MKLGKALTRMAGIMMSVCMLAALTVPAAATADIASGSKYEPLDERQWELVWYDEFNGAAVDTGKWAFTLFSCSEGCLKADIYTTLPNTWSTQFYQNVNITEPGTYRLSFSAKASMPRQICVAVEKDGMAPPLNPTFDISCEWAEYLSLIHI